MALDDAARKSQADSGTLEVLGALKPLKHAEDFIDITHIEADAIVLDRIKHLPITDSAAYGYDGFRARAGIFDCVFEEVEPDLAKQSLIAPSGRKVPDIPDNSAILGLQQQRLLDLGDQLFHVHIARANRGASVRGR